MELEHKVKSYILSNYLFTEEESALSSEESLLERGIIDSTGVLEVIFFLEGEFGVKVEDEEMLPENLDSVANIVAFVRRKKAVA